MMKYLELSHFLFYVAFLNVCVNICDGAQVKKSIDETQNTEDSSELSEDEDDTAIDHLHRSTCTRRADSLMHEIRLAKPKQFPFMAAVMSAEDKYLCSGSVVANGIILTTAKCTLLPVGYVLLNTTETKKEEPAVRLQVVHFERFPTFDPNFAAVNNIGLIYTQKHDASIASKILISNITSDRGVHDIEALGFGLNTETSEPRELKYIGLEVREMDQEKVATLNAYFDCVDTKIPTCFKDTGGPAIVGNKLIGIITAGQEECTKETTSEYAMNRKMIEFIPAFTFKDWLKEKINQSEIKNPKDLIPTYPEPLPMRRTEVNVTSTTPKPTTKLTTTKRTTTTAMPILVYSTKSDFRVRSLSNIVSPSKIPIFCLLSIFRKLI